MSDQEWPDNWPVQAIKLIEGGQEKIARLAAGVERLTTMHGGSQRALAKVIAENTAKQAVVEAADVVVEQWEGHMMESTKTVDLLPLVAAVQKYRALDGEP